MWSFTTMKRLICDYVTDFLFKLISLDVIRPRLARAAIFVALTVNSAEMQLQIIG